MTLGDSYKLGRCRFDFRKTTSVISKIVNM